MYFMRNFGGSVVKKPMCNSKKHCIIDKFPTKIGRIIIYFCGIFMACEGRKGDFYEIW